MLDNPLQTGIESKIENEKQRIAELDGRPSARRLATPLALVLVVGAFIGGILTVTPREQPRAVTPAATGSINAVGSERGDGKVTAPQPMPAKPQAAPGATQSGR